MNVHKQMMLVFSMLSAVTSAYASPMPSSTDEARALAAANRQVDPERSAPVVVSSTDDARAAAGARPSRAAGPRNVPMLQAVTSTDEARALVGGLVQLAPPAAAEAKKAACAKTCDCGRA
jgi:hypothetical protein